MPNNETDFNKIPVKDWDDARFKEFFKALTNAERNGKKVFSLKDHPHMTGVFWGHRSYLENSHPYLQIEREKLYVMLTSHDYETVKVDAKLQRHLFNSLEKRAQEFTLSIEKNIHKGGAWTHVAKIEPNLGYLQCDQNGFLNFETTVDFLIKCGEFLDEETMPLQD